ncbi:hypothetical protein ACLOJK_016074 [Asimina triloba]
MSILPPSTTLPPPPQPRKSTFSPSKLESKTTTFKSSRGLQNPSHGNQKFSSLTPHDNPILSPGWQHLLHISTDSGDFLSCLAIHAFLVKSGSRNDVFKSNNLLRMYVKFNRLDDALCLFDGMPVRDAVTWTTLISGHSEIHDVESVFRVANEMHRSGEIFNERTCNVVLQSCSRSQECTTQGEQVHALAIKSGFETNVFVATSLVSMYSRSGSLAAAENIFKDLIDVDIRCVNSMILEYGKIGDARKAVGLFCDLQSWGLQPNDYTFTNAISACSGNNSLDIGRQLHCAALKFGLVGVVSVGNAIVTMYAKNGLVEEAEKMFRGMSNRDFVSWTAILSAYSREGHGERAMERFVEMLHLGISIDCSCLATAVDACSECRNPTWGFQIHGLAIKLQYHSHTYVGTALIAYYVGSGDVKSANKVFDGLSDQNTASFNALLGGYLKIDGHEEDNIMTTFGRLRSTGMEPDSVTLAQFLSLSADQASLLNGRCLHASAIKTGLEDDVILGNAMVTMYAKCGSIEDAYQIFRNMVSRDTVTWNAMISACALHGQGKEALLLLKNMEREGYVPNQITLVAVLQACSYSGLYEDGLYIFNTMEERYGIVPVIEHEAGKIDLLGRAGHLVEAVEFVRGSQFAASPLLWRTLVNACKLRGDMNVGRLASETLLHLAPDDAASYILVANLYAVGGMLEESAKMRVIMNERKVKKDVGYSWIEIDDTVHCFMAGATDHIQSKQIYSNLEKLNEEMKERSFTSTGCTADVSFA